MIDSQDQTVGDDGTKTDVAVPWLGKKRLQLIFG
jgi:hypothetical protein